MNFSSASTVRRMSAVWLFVACGSATGNNLTGQSGLIQMPDGRVQRDGEFSVGLMYSPPYSALWTTVGMLPFLETTGRFTRFAGLPGFGPQYSAYGDYKDKTFDLKVRLLEEGEVTPSVSFGLNDFEGTGIFRATYVAASKRVGPFDFTVGRGQERIDGAFAGVRWTPEGSPWSLLAEYDATDYKRDKGATVTGVASRPKGVNVGAEYRNDWMSAQLSRVGGQWSTNLALHVPLNAKAFIPKTDEPEPFTEVAYRPSLQEWHKDALYREHLLAQLIREDFRDIGLEVNDGYLHLSLSNARISNMPRAVGRAARIALLAGPRDLRGLKITYTQNDLPIATYTFFAPDVLERYFSGQATRKELSGYVEAAYAQPSDSLPPLDVDELFQSLDKSNADIRLGEGGNLVALGKDSAAGHFRLVPKLNFHFNDPGGVLRYSLLARGSYERRLGDGWYLSGAVDATVAEDVSQVRQRSNSLLPHVRTDVADYLRDSRVKLSSLTLSKYFAPAPRWFARVSGGIYETMFDGVGAQLLYVPERSQWAADATLDWVRQRDTKGGFGLRDYTATTGLLSLHYRLPYDMTATARMGRFLAKDEGVRFELKRRFKSGIELGAWYSHTNGNDITTPGSPNKPYRDKGIFFTIPLEVLLPRDTRATAVMALSPWTRDVGQMVAYPGDLYDQLENPLRRQFEMKDGLSGFGDVDDDYDTEPAWPGVRDYWQEAAGAARVGLGGLAQRATWRAIGAGVLATALASRLDRPLNTWLKDRRSETRLRQFERFGSMARGAGFVASAGLAWASQDQRLSETALSATKAAAAAGLVTWAGKGLFDRSRPRNSDDPYDFGSKGDGSFPSGHAAMAWAMATPYALEYDQPVWYGLAALVSASRVTARQHWFSDTVAGGLIGYGLGYRMWQSQRERQKGPKITVLPNGVQLDWQTP